MKVFYVVYYPETKTYMGDYDFTHNLDTALLFDKPQNMMGGICIPVTRNIVVYTADDDDSRTN